MNKIARAITASGYPARIWKNLSPEKLEAEQTRAIKMSRDYVASVGGRNISRYDYDGELEIQTENQAAGSSCRSAG